ncbi:MAG: hypothetical protein RR675_00250 [Oscillospiraceae bacterium]
MPTTFTNKAVASGMVGSASVTGTSNEVISTMVTNLELCKTQSLTVVKSGGTQAYTVTIKNANSIAATNVEFMDNIPVGMSYVTGTFKVNGAVTTPVLTGNILKYVIPSIGANITTTVEFTVMVA